MRTRRYLFTTDHHAIGLQYLALSVIAVLVGATLSLLMRLHLAYPGLTLPMHGPILPEEYLALVTLHGTIMLFFVLTTAPQAGIGNLILPAQIGARRMAFPGLNAASFWTTALALCVLVSSSFVEGGAAISGWTAYPPLSAIASAGPGQGLGMDLWLAAIALFAIATTMASVNTLTTIIRERCDGMTWERLPLTVWAWFTAALLSLIAFSVLLAALLLLFLDRHASTSFFIPTGDLTNGVFHSASSHGNGSPLLWLHLFWFFGHPEVYIAILPGMGLTSMLIANFSHRRPVAYRTMITTTLLIGGLGILVWGHHMFVAGLNPFAGTAFSISTMAIALPSTAKVLSWLATTWRSRPRMATPMLWSLGFVSLFMTGGLTGPILAQPILDQYLHNTFFVVAHFHLIMAMAGIFGLCAAIYYYFPLFTGRMLSESLGRWHFWLTIFFAYNTFLPMHFTGLMGEPRHYAQLTGIPNAAGQFLLRTMSLQRHITASAIGLALAQIPFVWNLAVSLRHGEKSPQNPWNATTLEWHPDLAPFSAPTGDSITVHHPPCEYQKGTFLPQWAAISASNEKPE